MNPGPRQAMADASPPVFQIRWIDEEYISRQDVPGEHGDVERVFNTQMKKQAQQQHWIAESPEPDEDPEGKLKRQSEPTARFQYRGGLDPPWHGKPCQRMQMDDVIECRSVEPGVALHLPPECGQVHQRQLELDHSLRPGGPRLDLGAFQPPANSYQTVY